MSKWLVTHTPDGITMLEDIVEADTFEEAYFKVLEKAPMHYPVGTICSGITSVERIID